METLNDLKQVALMREQEREAAALDAIYARNAENARRNASLLGFIQKTEPFSALAMNAHMTTSEDIYSNGPGAVVVVTFDNPAYANIDARFRFNNRDLTWEHVGFATNAGFEYSYWRDDPEKMYLVRAFDRIEWESESEEYYARYTTTYFADIGDALLAAERAFVDPQQIAKKLAEVNATKAFTSPVAVTEPPAPEPTTEEIFISSLKDLILEYASQTRED